MFVSKRVLFFKSKKNGYLLFCGNSNSFYQIDDETLPSVKKMFDTGDDSDLPEDVKQEFIKSGVLLKENDDELFKRLKYISYLTRFDNDYLNLTIAPTMACNFKCSYCFEGERVRNLVMSQEVLDKVVDFVKLRNYKRLEITWYGGEPLCAWNKIVEFNQKFDALGIPLIEQSIVTNGSLLDEEKIAFFIEKNFKMVQITLDGDEETQNQRRPMKNGQSSYQTIMKNLDLTYNYCVKNQKHINIRIRINVDKTNIDMYQKMYQMLNERYHHMFYIYPAFVKKTAETDCHAKNCLNFREAAKFILELSEKYKIFTYQLFPKTNVILGCPIQKTNMYVIDTDGDIYKCWDDICIPERKIGNVVTGMKDVHNINQLYVMNSSGFEDPKCKDCLFLYSCMGGCPRSKFLNEEAKKELNPVCSVIKDKPEEFLESYFELKTKE